MKLPRLRDSLDLRQIQHARKVVRGSHEGALAVGHEERRQGGWVVLTGCAIEIGEIVSLLCPVAIDIGSGLRR